MSDATHLLIPFASCGDEPGCIEVRRTLALPALEKLLARLKPSAVDEGDERALSLPYERVLSRELGIAAPDGCIPWAAWEEVQAGHDAGPDAWAWITPCHWQVGREDILMTHPQQLELTAAESQTLVAAMQPYFAQDGIALEYRAPTLWVARGEVFRGLASASLDRVVGHGVGAWLPTGDGARIVRRLQQEMQMLLYTHNINEERSAVGLLPVNSFWVSGTGALAESHAKSLGPPPAGLRITHYLRDTALLGDWRAWASGWHQIDTQQCTRLLAWLDHGDAVSLTLCGARNARTFSGRGGGWVSKLAARLAPRRAQAVLDSL